MTEDLIIQTLNEKLQLKNVIANNTQHDFIIVKRKLQLIASGLAKKLGPQGEVSVKENGDYEIELRFAGEVLIFSMHTDIFNFDDGHFTHKLDYVKNDITRSFCGVIKVYNFLADSFKYNRHNDLGYLIARIFINKENHFFVEGKRQLGFLYNDFENAVIDDDTIQAVLESCILYAIEFDLLVPPFDEIKEITVYQKIEQMGNAAVKTGKRLGFKFQADNDQFNL
jgi:hypothetical protein